MGIMSACIAAGDADKKTENLPGKSTSLYNEKGEIPDHGPPWACARFGASGHDYQACLDCHQDFFRRLQDNLRCRVTL
jgi:hypothetical protein